MTEDQLQAKIWTWLWNEHPETRRCVWAVPNGAIGRIITVKDQIQANKMKATGLMEGVWDLHMMWNGQFYIIETKVPGGVLSVDRVVNGKKHFGQREWGELMERHGAKKFVYYSFEEGQEILKSIICTK